MNFIKNFFFYTLISLIIYTECIYSIKPFNTAREGNESNLPNNPNNFLSYMYYNINNESIQYSSYHFQNLEELRQLLVSSFINNNEDVVKQLEIEWDHLMGPKYFEFINNASKIFFHFVQNNIPILSYLINKTKTHLQIPINNPLRGVELLELLERVMILNIDTHAYLISIYNNFKNLKKYFKINFSMNVINSSNPIFLFLKLNKKDNACKIYITNMHVYFDKDTHPKESMVKVVSDSQSKMIKKCAIDTLKTLNIIPSYKPPPINHISCHKFGFIDPSKNWIDFFNKHNEAMCRVKIEGNGDCLFLSLTFLINKYQINLKDPILNAQVPESSFVHWYINNIKPKDQNLINHIDMRYIVTYFFIKYFPGFDNGQEFDENAIMDKLDLYINIENTFFSSENFGFNKSDVREKKILEEKKKLNLSSSTKIEEYKDLPSLIDPKELKSDNETSFVDNVLKTNTSSSDDLFASNSEDDKDKDLIQSKRRLIENKRSYDKTSIKSNSPPSIVPEFIKNVKRDSESANNESDDSKNGHKSHKKKSHMNVMLPPTYKDKSDKEDVSNEYSDQSSDRSSDEDIISEINNNNCRKYEKIHFVIVSLSNINKTLSELKNMSLNNVKKLDGIYDSMRVLSYIKNSKWAIPGIIIPLYRLEKMEKMLSEPFNTTSEATEEFFIVLKSTFRKTIRRSIDEKDTKSWMSKLHEDKFSYSSIKDDDYYFTSDGKIFTNLSVKEKAISLYYERTRRGNNHWGDENDIRGFQSMFNIGLIFFLNNATRFFFSRENFQQYPTYFSMYYHSETHFEPSVHIKKILESENVNFSYPRDLIPQSFHEVAQMS